MSSELEQEVAFVVLSCDRYSDLWGPCFARMRRYWPGLSLDTYVIANKRRFEGPGVATLLAGEDHDWSTTVRIALQQIHHPYVFCWFDDAFLNAPIDQPALYRMLRWGTESGADYLRLRDVPKPAERVADNIGRLTEGVAYRNTCFAALWRREVFLRLLVDGESAGQFEMNGTHRSDAYPKFYGAYRRPFEYLHGVVSGTWLRSTLRQLVASGDVGDAVRPVMSARSELVWRINELKGATVAALAPGWADRVFALKRALLGRRP